MPLKVWILFIGFILLPALNAAEKIQTTHTQLQLISEYQSLQPGQSVWLGLYFKLEPGWHTYYKNPGDSGLPPKVIWNLPAGIQAHELEFPAPYKIETPPLTNFGYKKEVVLLTRLEIPKSFSNHEIEIKAQVNWLVCNQICLPASANLTLTLPVKKTTASIDTRWQKLISETLINIQKEKQGVILDPAPNPSWLLILLAAFLGGSILNLMPCVFPVLAIKVLGIMQLSSKNKKLALLHGFFYGLGILVSFWALTGLIFLLKALGTQIGWGFQLQSPEFLVLIIGVFFLMALNLLGFLEIPFLTAPHVPSTHRLISSFLQGVLAVIIASPCTAPFMGWAAGFALSTNFFQAWLIFSLIGMGMAWPTILLTAKPDWIQKLPKPGAWMEILKQSMGFLMLVSMLWLLWVLSDQISADGITLSLCGILILAFGIWILNLSQKKLIQALALLILIMGFGILFFSGTAFKEKNSILPAQTQTENFWEKYSEERLQQLLAQKKPVFVDFTAKWCLTCQVNKKLVLDQPQVLNHFKVKGYTLLQADWTQQDSIITQALQRLGRAGVPVYVIYKAPEFKPKLLPEILTVPMILKAAH